MCVFVFVCVCASVCVSVCVQGGNIPLVLSSELHLLYLITPLDMVGPQTLDLHTYREAVRVCARAEYISICLCNVPLVLSSELQTTYLITQSP